MASKRKDKAPAKKTSAKGKHRTPPADKSGRKIADAERDAAIRAVAKPFLASLPPEAASSGHWLAPEDGEVVRVENGAYRIAGTEWIFVFRGRRLVEVNKAVAPTWGGPDVIHVPAEEGLTPAQPR